MFYFPEINCKPFWQQEGIVASMKQPEFINRVAVVWEGSIQIHSSRFIHSILLLDPSTALHDVSESQLHPFIPIDCAF